MARIPYVEPVEAPPAVREVYDVLGREPLNIFKLIANAESAFRPFMRFGAAILGALELDPKLRELAILRVAQLSDARYEWVQHAAIAAGIGIPDAQIAALERGEIEADCFGELERRVLRFTTESVRDVRVSQATFDALAEHFSPRLIVELLLTIGQYMMVARVMEACAIDIEAPVGASILAPAARELDR
jgi:alkylhydroperoxidase family enzyme